MQNARKSLSFEGRDLIAENSTKKSVCPTHKVIRERSCSIMYTCKFLFSMETRRAERVTCSLDSHFFEFHKLNRRRINLSEMFGRNRKKRSRINCIRVGQIIARLPRGGQNVGTRIVVTRAED